MRRLVVLGALAAFCWPSNAWAQSGPMLEDSEVNQSVEASDAEDSPEWDIGLYGYIRLSYLNVQEDPNINFVGANNGFVLRNARMGVEGNYGEGLSFRLSIEGAADIRDNVNDLEGQFDVRLRDAYLQYGRPWLGLRAGQFKAPFSAEELRSTSSLLFASRAVGLEGVPVSTGFEEAGIVVSRELGVMLAPLEPIYFGDFGLAYYLAVSNGNGANEILNDNSSLALYGRLELYWGDLVRIGGSILSQDSSTGEPPNLFEQSEFGYSADLIVTWNGLEVSGQLTSLTTEFQTSGSPDRERFAYHAQVGYRVTQLPIPLDIQPAYRFAYYHPRNEGLDSFQLTYHTIGLNVHYRAYPLSLLASYTMTQEEAPRELENNRFEFLFQTIW